MHNPDHPTLGVALANLADTQLNLNEVDEAIINFEMALGIMLPKTPEHILIDIITLHLGICKGKQGQFSQAEALFEPAFTKLETNAGYRRERLAKAAAWIAEIYEAWEKPERAEAYRKSLKATKPSA